MGFLLLVKSFFWVYGYGATLGEITGWVVNVLSKRNFVQGWNASKWRGGL